MLTKIHGLVLRSANTKTLQKFYSDMGIEFKSHSHGGPIHAECQNVSNNFAVEIYKASANFYQDAILIETDSLDKSLEIAKQIGAPLLQPTKEMDNIRFAYIADPDGRPVMLLEFNKSTTS